MIPPPNKSTNRNDFYTNTNLRLRVDETDSVLVDGDQQDFGVVGLCGLLKMEIYVVMTSKYSLIINHISSLSHVQQ